MLGKRLARLEANRPALGVSCTVDIIGLASDVVARVTQATADGGFPQSLCDADLEAIIEADDILKACYYSLCI